MNLQLIDEKLLKSISKLSNNSLDNNTEEFTKNSSSYLKQLCRKSNK